MVAVEREVTGNESMSAILQFRIENAAPSVLLSGLKLFFSMTTEESISNATLVMDITNLSNRTTQSQLLQSFSSDGLSFNLTVQNIVQDRTGGEQTDEGRYFLQATNPAGSSFAYVDLVVFGKICNYRCLNTCKHLNLSYL